MLKSKSEYSRYYGDFRGVDFSSDHTLVADSRFPYLVNMYKDYAAGGGQGIETIPGFRRRFVAPNGGAVHGIHSYKDKGGKRHVLVHAGKSLYRWDAYPNDAGVTGNVTATVTEYDEYSASADESVRIDTDYIKIEVAASSAAAKFIDVRAIRKVGTQKWISIYTEAVYYGEATDAVRIPGAYTFAQRTDDDGNVTGAVLKIAKVIKDASGTVVASFAAGDAVEVQSASITHYPNGYYSCSLSGAHNDTGKVTADGSRIVYFEYDHNAIIYAQTLAIYKVNGGKECTFITPSAVPQTVYNSCSLGDATLVDYIVASDGSRFAPVTHNRVVNADLRVYFIYDSAQGYYYQPAADGSRIVKSQASSEFLNVSYIYHGQVDGVAYTALEYDEYVEDGMGDYLEVKGVDASYAIVEMRRASSGELITEGDGAGQYKRASGTILLRKGGNVITGETITLKVRIDDPTVVYEDMNERDSTSFVFKDRLYILDGKSYIVYDGDTVSRVVDNAYVPTTYINIIVGGENADAGEELEPRNMLSPYFKHTFVPDGETTEYYLNENELDGIKEVTVWGNRLEEGTDFEADLAEGKITFAFAPDKYLIEISENERVDGTAGIAYKKKDGSAYYECKGMGDASGDEIIIGNYYNEKAVVGIANRAFYGRFDSPAKVIISEGISKIGESAFENAYAVKSIELPASLEYIGHYAFSYSGIKSITIPRYVNSIAPLTFWNAKDLEEVEFKGVPSALSGDAFVGCDKIKKITVPWKKGIVEGEPWGAPVNAEIVYGEETSPTPMAYPEGYAGVEITAEKAIYPAIEGDGETTGAEFRSMIESATIATVFDNRVFFSGVPAKPNFIFWSSLKNPSYIGILNYQQDGVGTTPITAMVPVAKTLLVLKGDTEDGGAAFYHTPAESGIDVMSKAYPSEEGLAGIGCLGAACNFLDDPVYVSRLGLEGIEYLSLQNERSRGHRSSLVDAKLVNAKNLASAKMCEWSGYLVLLVDGRIFLADSRQRYTDAMGSAQYEWYYLEDIGVYKGQHKKYSYLKEYPEVLLGEDGEPRTVKVTYNGKEYPVKLIGDILPDSDMETVGEGIDTVIAQVESAEGFKIEIVAAMYEQNGEYHACLCDTNDEMIGGTFCPAVVIKTVDEGGENLYFGTTNGVVCSFNFDKRGADGAIPPDYYTFDGRAIYSGCALKMDNCGIPHMTKTTVKKSTVIKAKSFMRTAAKVRVRTNKNPYNEIARINGTRFSFEDMDFSDFSFVVGEDTLFAIREKEKKWVEKQYYVYSDEFKKPFALYYLAYKYFIAGKYKG